MGRFYSTPDRRAGAFGYLRYSPFYVDPGNFATGTRLRDANTVYLPRKGESGDRTKSGDGYRSAVFKDADESRTGRRDAIVTVNNPLLQGEGCHLDPHWNAAVCDGGYVYLFVEDHARSPYSAGPVSIRREEGGPR